MSRRAVPIGLACSRCARRVTWSGSRGRYVHAGGGPVAACDLDSEHPAEPDWAGIGDTPCAVCEEPLVASGGGFVHRDPARDSDHAADSGFPGFPGG